MYPIRSRLLAHVLDIRPSPRFYSFGRTSFPPVATSGPVRTPTAQSGARPSKQPTTPKKPRVDPSNPGTGASNRRTRYALVKRPDVTTGHERPSQRPFGVSQTIQKMFAENKLKEAIEMVEKSPLSSQNVVVWTLLVREALEQQKLNLAFKLWNNMKKRGFQPESRSYATFFSGCAKIESLSPSSMDRIRSIWSDFQDYKTQLRSANARGQPYPPDASVSPYVPYLALESQYTLGEGIMEIFNSMTKDGPFAPDKFVFTTMMNLIARRKAFREGAIICRQPDKVGIQNAADARKVWQRMKESAESSSGSRLVIDSHALAAFLRAQVRGTKEQQQYGVEVGTEMLGFRRNQQDTKPVSTVPPERHALDVFLQLCNSTEQYELCIACTREVMEAEKGNATLARLTCSNFHHALTAYGYLSTSKKASKEGTVLPYANESLQLIEWMLRKSYSNVGPQIRPDRKCFNLALLTSWRCKDWPSMESIFSIMTGLDHSIFDTTIASKPQSSKPPKTRQDFDTQSMSYMVRTALELQDHRIMAKCVRMFLHYGVVSMFPSGAAPDTNQTSKSIGERGGMDDTYFQNRLADGLSKVLSILWATKMDPVERKDFKALLTALEPIQSNFRKHTTTRTVRNTRQTNSHPII